MGSWNGTCMISNLHIKAGQKIAIFLMTPKTGYYSTCHSNTYYDVCPLPFYGEYNDYGGAENCNGPVMEKLVKLIKKDLCEMPQGDNEYHERAVSKHNFDIDALFQAEEDDRLGIVDFRSRELFSAANKQKLEDDLGDIPPEVQENLDRLFVALAKPDLSKSMKKIRKVFIHGDIFDAILDNFYLEQYVGHQKGNAGYDNCYFHNYYNDVKASIPEFVQILKEWYTALDEDSLYREFALLRARGLDQLFEEKENIAGKYIGWFEGSDSPHFLISVQSEIFEYCKKDDWEGLADFVAETLKTLWINSYLEHTRKHWIVTTGSGGQIQEHRGYQVLIDAMQKVLKEERSGDDYEEEEDEEEEETLSEELVQFSKELDKMEAEDKEMFTPDVISNTVSLLNKAAIALATK